MDCGVGHGLGGGAAFEGFACSLTLQAVCDPLDPVPEWVNRVAATGRVAYPKGSPCYNLFNNGTCCFNLSEHAV